ncbi:hypothetical protein B0H17DRAFT_1175388 [Mycena rosella]|uniref:MYND-type domain-containing protein n=1 Tax=Mycena rosella TaxID=1033263 RepID=A0AAD7GT76_MYCRO|nr:hypothetical protein B0H17DRAFT_1175388 [Mycena rosella]
MSRDASMKFTPASVGDSYDKMSQCSHCYKEPTKKPFPVCASCKEASFCSKECQAKAWPLHKTFCQHRKKAVAAMAHSPSSPEFPPFAIRKHLLTDFIELIWAKSAFSSALILEGGIDNFAFDKRVIFVLLKYRPDCNENPSVAFSVEGCALMTELQMEALFGQRRVGGAMEAMIDAQSRASHAGYRGLLHVYFKMEDHIVAEAYPQAHVLGDVGEVHRKYVVTVDHTKWVTRVQQFVRDGLVMRAPAENVLMMQLGRMSMKKGKWVWVQLTKAELVQLGYPSHFPGLLF